MLRFLLSLSFLFILVGCDNNDYSPKPRAYHRIEFPIKSFETINISGCPFTFEIPTYSVLKDDLSKGAKTCWKNIVFKNYNAQLHLSYYSISPKSTLEQLTEDARSFVFKHTTKATAIDQQNISYPEHKVSGLTYNIQGNTASNFQFYATDSNKNYLRGALYFNEKPNLDSIQPVLDFLKSDIQHLISTIRWK
ncbi:MAG: gliding motility lipoprotein GldD [Sphingobacterium composti]|uniref:gliding motility lipoprotein GldD n=1 Tax=Sphingobacterium composti TaxID=363260 RepID=UPI001358753B|nr:gliding motility lipoprotein GldD [Sphingobacterium composti Ten et al. 2007 non Yoo et al. 2007]